MICGWRFCSSIKNPKNRRMTAFSSRPKKERIFIKLTILLDDDITYIYIHVHTYTYIYIYIYVYIHIHAYTYIYVDLYTYAYIYIHIHTYTYKYTIVYTSPWCGTNALLSNPEELFKHTHK